MITLSQSFVDTLIGAMKSAFGQISSFVYLIVGIELAVFIIPVLISMFTLFSTRRTAEVKKYGRTLSSQERSKVGKFEEMEQKFEKVMSGPDRISTKD